MDKGFTILPRDVLEHKHLSSSAKLLYAKIVDFGFNGLYSYPTQMALAEALNLSDKQIRNLLTELLEFGLIKVWRRGVKLSNFYVIVPLECVDNLYREFKPIASADYCITEEDFTKMVIWQESFFTNAMEAKEKALRAKMVDGDWDELSEREFCYYFAMRYRETYETSYNVTEADVTTLTSLYSAFAIESGENRKRILDVFIDDYDSNFKNDNFQHPMICSLKVQWVREKLLKLVYERMQREQREAENSADFEIIGEIC
jgi:hypothetical protein